MRDLDAPTGDDPTVQLSRARSAAAQRGDPTTEVMSLDELMDLAASRPATSTSAEPTVAEAYPAETAHPAAPPRPPMPVVPVRSEPALAAGPTTGPAAAPTPAASAPATAGGRTARGDLQRLSQDAARAYRATIEQATTWLKAGDHGLIAATAALTILLIILVAAL